MPSSTKEVVALMQDLHNRADHQEFKDGFKKAAEQITLLESQLREAQQERQKAIHNALWEFHDSYSWGSGATDAELPLYLAGQNLRSFADNYSPNKK